MNEKMANDKHSERAEWPPWPSLKELFDLLRDCNREFKVSKLKRASGYYKKEDLPKDKELRANFYKGASCIDNRIPLLENWEITGKHSLLLSVMEFGSKCLNEQFKSSREISDLLPELDRAMCQGDFDDKAPYAYQITTEVLREVARTTPDPRASISISLSNVNDLREVFNVNVYPSDNPDNVLESFLTQRNNLMVLVEGKNDDAYLRIQIENDEKTMDLIQYLRERENNAEPIRDWMKKKCVM